MPNLRNMKYIQTFWTAGQDPLGYGFGWSHPEYNLMSWALSCLSLREHYNNVELYTDSVGYHILIEVLGLPYTKTHVVFDDFKCLPHHWALSKIKTYSIQTEPFIHVDGDVYISKPLPKYVENASLIVQNEERTTDYYQNMVDRILSVKTLHINDDILSRVKNGTILSYNLGIFGGHDLDFIHKYCENVFNFMDTNQMNDKNSVNSSTRCNVFFEQILFAMYSKLMNKKVTSLIPILIDDNGYTSKDFGDLKNYFSSSYFHILGSHKTRKSITSFLKKILLLKNSNIYEKMIPLFPENHIQEFKSSPVENTFSIERSIAQYDDFKEECLQKWHGLNLKDIINLETNIASYLCYKDATFSKKKDFLFKVNPYLTIFSISDKWHPKAILKLRNRYHCEPLFPLKDIAMMPSTNYFGINEVPLTDFECDIISIMRDRVISFDQIFHRLMETYLISDKKNTLGLFINVLEQLLKQGVIILANETIYNY